MPASRRHHPIADSASLEKLDDASRSLADHRRHLVADFCRLIGHRIAANDAPSPVSSTPAISNHAADPELPPLSPRMRQTLDALLQGDSEKQIAAKLNLSRHTVHVYVKALYRGFEVNSRGELLARFVHRDRTPVAAR